MKESSQTLWVGLSFAVVGLTIGLMLNSMDSFGKTSVNGAGDQEQEVQAPGSGKPVAVSVDDDPFLGDVDAPVTIIEFSDFQCPYCSKFVNETLPSLKENYIDKGLVKLVYRDYPLGGHANAHLAAETAECADESAGDEAYFKVHDALFANQASWALLETPLDYFVDLASTSAGVDVRSCLENGEMVQEVDADFAAGRSYNNTGKPLGTPTFFINGRMVVGAYPYEIFSQIIESEL